MKMTENERNKFVESILNKIDDGKPLSEKTMDLDLESYAQEVLEKITNNKNFCDTELELILECFEVDNMIMEERHTEYDGRSIIKLGDKFFGINYQYYFGEVTYYNPFYEVVKRVGTIQVPHWIKI